MYILDAERAETSPRVVPAEQSGCAEWVARELEFDADTVQRRVLGSRAWRGLLNCTRQWGKSTVAAARSVYQASTEAGSLTVVVSPSARQSGELVRKAEEFARRLGVRTKGDGGNEISLEFPNGSRIVGLPGNEATTRGFSAVALLLVDEAARVSDDLYRAIRPMLAVSGGTLWLMSTPFGKRGLVWETWEHGGGGVGTGAGDGGGVPADRAGVFGRGTGGDGRGVVPAECLCEFVDAVRGVFGRDLVEGAITHEVKPLVID